MLYKHPSLSILQRRSIGIAVLLNILVPLSLFSFKPDIWQFSKVAFWVVDQALFLFLPLATMWILARQYSISPRAYFLRLPPKLNLDLLGLSILSAGIIAAAYWPVSQFAWRVLGAYGFETQFTYLNALPNGVLRTLALVPISLQAGLFESVIFIGWPWLLFGDRCFTGLGKIQFALVSALAFGASHLSNGLPEVIATTCFGLAAAYLFLRFGDLWPVILGHALADLIGLM